MEILWGRGESNVRDVVDRLGRPLAYTTVMTTLDRLFKKGLLARRKADRAFFYSPTLSREQWDHKRAGDFVAGFLSVPEPSRDLLVSCLVEAVGRHDEALLDELEKKIKLRRKEERAFLYSPRWSRREWDEKRAGEILAAFLAGPRTSGELLISCLVEAVGRHDEGLLDELEKKIKLRRKELYRRPKP